MSAWRDLPKLAYEEIKPGLNTRALKRRHPLAHAHEQRVYRRLLQQHLPDESELKYAFPVRSV